MLSGTDEEFEDETAVNGMDAGFNPDPIVLGQPASTLSGTSDSFGLEGRG
jgi:hypothetical protein